MADHEQRNGDAITYRKHAEGVAFALISLLVVGCSPDAPQSSSDLPSVETTGLVFTKEGHAIREERSANGEVRTFMELAEGYSDPGVSCVLNGAVTQQLSKTLQTMRRYYSPYAGFQHEPDVKAFLETLDAVCDGMRSVIEEYREAEEAHSGYHWKHVEGNRWELKNSTCEIAKPIYEKTIRQFEKLKNYALREHEKAERAVAEYNARQKERLLELDESMRMTTRMLRGY